MKGLDGQSATPAPANMKTMSAEIWEALTNLTLVERRLLIDSGGPGEFRGGLGQRLVLRNDTADPVYVAILGSRTEYPALGYAGGLPAASRRYLVRGEPVHAKGRYMLRPGELITIEDSGGGGFGDPRKRPLERVRADVAAGFVSLAAARDIYGASV
jgi:N-methylhydantoinase B